MNFRHKIMKLRLGWKEAAMSKAFYYRQELATYEQERAAMKHRAI